MWWIAVNVLTPFVPVVIGMAVRSSRYRSISFDLLDASDLAFALTVVCILTLTGVRRDGEEGWQELLFLTFMIGTLLFAGLFALTKYVQLNQELYLADFFNAVTFDNAVPFDASALRDPIRGNNPQELYEEYSYLRVFTTAVGTVFTATAVCFKWFSK